MNEVKVLMKELLRLRVVFSTLYDRTSYNTYIFIYYLWIQINLRLDKTSWDTLYFLTTANSRTHFCNWISSFVVRFALTPSTTVWVLKLKLNPNQFKSKFTSGVVQPCFSYNNMLDITNKCLKLWQAKKSAPFQNLENLYNLI